VLSLGRNWAVGDTALCANRGKKFSGGRCSVVC